MFKNNLTQLFYLSLGAILNNLVIIYILETKHQIVAITAFLFGFMLLVKVLEKIFFEDDILEINININEID